MRDLSFVFKFKHHATCVVYCPKKRIHALKYDENSVTIPIDDKDHTSGVLSLPGRGRKRTAVIIAHGAGYGWGCCYSELLSY
jgi:hypothetical protein